MRLLHPKRVRHVLTLFGATTLVPLIFGPAMGMTTPQVAVFVSCVYLAMGLATLLQTSRFGSGLPIVQGSSFSFIPPVMTIIGIYGSMGPNICMQYIGGALILGGLLLGLVGYTRLVGKLKKYIGPITIGPTIMAIGFSLAPVAVGMNAANYWPASLGVVFLIFLFSLRSDNKFLNIFSILSAVVIVYVLSLVASLSGLIQAGHPVFIDLQNVFAAPWFKFTGIAPWGMPKFSLMAFGAILAGFFAVFIESIGDYFNVSNAAGLEDPSEETINRGIGAEGIGCVIGGLAGAVACTSYTENIGLIGLTGVASRNVVRAGAVILLVMSLIGKLGALIATIPTPIIGGCYIALFGIIGALGIQALMRADMNSQRNVMIVGFAFLMALGLPSWVGEHKDLFFSLGIIGEIVWAIGNTAMAVAGISACILDNLIPGSQKERGFQK
ncbi:MAG TPA: solute carrier family 23 protein [Synergistales bacterium]|nr:solute carrier family 23 protein [Synergistales bacterium]